MSPGNLKRPESSPATAPKWGSIHSAHHCSCGDSLSLNAQLLWDSLASVDLVAFSSRSLQVQHADESQEYQQLQSSLTSIKQVES